MKFFLIFVFSVIFSKKNNAKYIKQEKRPLNIAHRGLSYIFPQNTLQSFSAALYQGTDFIELDVVYTKQFNLLVMHDPYLSRLTNVTQLQTKFKHLKKKRIYKGQQKQDWWTDTFSLQDLQKLTIKQKLYPNRLSIFDNLWSFSTLQQVINLVIMFNKQHRGQRNPNKRLAGILIEAKDSQMYRQLFHKQLGESILKTLKLFQIDTPSKSQLICPIYLHSFDYETVKWWSKYSTLPVNYLLQYPQKFNLYDINLYATGIGVDDKMVWNYQTGQEQDLVKKAHQLDLLVHVYTFRDQILMFNSSNSWQNYRKSQINLKLDGVITQFCDVYSSMSIVIQGIRQLK